MVGPEPFQGFVTTKSFAGLWYSRVGHRSQPQRLIEAISSFDIPRLQPRTVIRVPPDEGTGFGRKPCYLLAHGSRTALDRGLEQDEA
ncbi:hypothetical protein OS493_021198 [Desmophyllum pertusum]|uniref:Uncharacterized protein n=1 Tax=Desmophyllum pertusum TaxID=174260 RepID=A0A9X0D2A3_9CNID|nr:hypothetical protein OS493_021198 [Desmophyllum pertusum]